MRLSLVVGVLMFVGKTVAYRITGSAAILSDAAESVVHVIAVALASFSLWLSFQPADQSHPYGHDKVSFFSAGFEGALIVLAAFYIIYQAIAKWWAGLHLENLEIGTLAVLGAALLNAGLGIFLVSRGRKHRSLILIADGKHVLTDSWTSFGVVAGLTLTLRTGWLPFDPILAILVALNILWSGGKLMRQAIGGLMDEAVPPLAQRVKTLLDEGSSHFRIGYHGLRCRDAGRTLWVEFHLLFPGDTALEQAHRVATEVERRLTQRLPVASKIISHLEPIEDHDRTHGPLHEPTAPSMSRAQ